jgi:hypothetical protein
MIKRTIYPLVIVFASHTTIKMKYTLLKVITIVSIFPLVTNAQWTGSAPGPIYYNSGFVGIGTTTPLRKFTVSAQGDGASVTSLLRLEQYNPGTPVNGTGVSIDMAIGDNSNLPPLAGQIRLMRSDYINSSMYFSTALANTVSDRMVINPYGNIGIGTTSPSQKLTVSAQGNGMGVTPLLRLEQYNPGSHANGTGVSIDMAIGDNTNLPALAGQIRLVRSDYLNTSMYFSTALGNTISDKMIIDPYGNIGIGTNNTMGHKLAVNGDIIATSVNVKLFSDWPDYVFKPAYKLPPLSDVKKFIYINQHLSDIPSAEQMSKNGINLGEMSLVLVRKVEELTLYLIEQNKQLQAQLKATESQKKINRDQQEQIDQLKTQLILLSKKLK